MKTSTLRSGVFLTAPSNHLMAPARSRLSTFTTAKSVFGFDGSLLGHATSPTLRAFSGGMEISIATNEGAGARSPVNISPGFVERSRVVTTIMLTWLAAGDVSATGSRTAFGRPAQADTKISRVETSTMPSKRGTNDTFVNDRVFSNAPIRNPFGHRRPPKTVLTIASNR